MTIFRHPARLAGGLAAAAAPGAALAQEAGGPPKPWQIDFPEPASPVMAEIVGFHDLLLVVITLIALFVTALMGYAMVRFRASANPTPTRTTHNPKLEIIWTVIPTIILIVIAVPSFRLLYYAETHPEPDLTIKAIGASWYWMYEYPDDGIELFATMVDEEDLEEGQPRLLATDAPVVVPVDKVVKVQVTSDDVIHAWAVPAFGVKVDAVPGRLNEIWFVADKTGTFYGQCSELCGTNHAFMPIEVKVVTQAEYDEWRALNVAAAAPDATRESS